MLDQVAAALKGARTVVALAGAGISTESGVPTFRGARGLWRRFRAEDLATPEAFGRDPALVWEWYRWRRAQIATALPNEVNVEATPLTLRADFVLRAPAGTVLPAVEARL